MASKEPITRFALLLMEEGSCGSRLAARTTRGILTVDILIGGTDGGTVKAGGVGIRFAHEISVGETH